MKDQKRSNNQTAATIYKVTSVVAVVIIAILFAFPLYWIITGAFKTGAEINSTMTIMYYIYYNAFKLYKYGYGNAMGVILAIIIAILSAIQFKLGEEK